MVVRPLIERKTLTLQGVPLQELFGGGYFGICVDKFGVRWMFNCANKE